MCPCSPRTLCHVKLIRYYHHHQVCLSSTVNDVPTSVDRLARCIADLAAWLSASQLSLNPTKTQVLWLGSKYQVDRITVRHVPVLSSSVQVVDSACDLGVVIDSHLTMVDHVTVVCCAAYFHHLLQLRLITRALSVDAAKTLVQSFITCHLDYCNALFRGITDSLFRRLQSVQNAAARLVTGTRRRDHITPMLRQLHWLPVRQRVEFKLALLVYKALHDASAAYLVDDCQLVSHASRRRLRSADIDTCCVPRTNKQLRDRSFAAAGLRLWNSLPARIRQPDNDIGEFRWQLQSFLFNWHGGACWLLLLCACSLTHIYLDDIWSLWEPIARTPLNTWVYLSCLFEYTQRKNRCKNAKSTLKSRWVHSNFEWRNSPLKSPLNR